MKLLNILCAATEDSAPQLLSVLRSNGCRHRIYHLGNQPDHLINHIQAFRKQVFIMVFTSY
jgi:hypothetical protein